MPTQKRIEVTLIDDGTEVHNETLKRRTHHPGWPRQLPRLGGCLVHVNDYPWD